MRRATVLNDFGQIVHNKQVDLLKSSLQSIISTHVDEIVEIVTCQHGQQVLLAIIDHQQKLQVIGCGDHVENVRGRVEMCVRLVNDLQTLCETIGRDAFEFDFALSALAHATREHGPKVVRTCCQYAFVHIESFVLNKKRKLLMIPAFRP